MVCCFVCAFLAFSCAFRKLEAHMPTHPQHTPCLGLVGVPNARPAARNCIQLSMLAPNPPVMPNPFPHRPLQHSHPTSLDASPLLYTNTCRWARWSCGAAVRTQCSRQSGSRRGHRGFGHPIGRVVLRPGWRGRGQGQLWCCSRQWGMLKKRSSSRGGVQVTVCAVQHFRGAVC